MVGGGLVLEVGQRLISGWGSGAGERRVDVTLEWC